LRIITVNEGGLRGRKNSRNNYIEERMLGKKQERKEKNRRHIDTINLYGKWMEDKRLF